MQHVYNTIDKKAGNFYEIPFMDIEKHGNVVD